MTENSKCITRAQLATILGAAMDALQASTSPARVSGTDVSSASAGDGETATAAAAGADWADVDPDDWTPAQLQAAADAAGIDLDAEERDGGDAA